MKKILRTLGAACLLVTPVLTAEVSKTTTPVMVDPSLLNALPYRFNGAVARALNPKDPEKGMIRGSGFCASNKRIFFSAAHVVMDHEEGSDVAEWSLPVHWFPRIHTSADLDLDAGTPTRGYFRWTEYKAMVAAGEMETNGFSRDVIVGFSFQDLMKGSPGTINFNGINDLKKTGKTLITGYPADDFYTGNEIPGCFMHRTGPVTTRYQTSLGSALQTTLVATGHGNSGGPVWTENETGGWEAAGVLVGGLPSESVVYSFSQDTKALLRVVAPVTTNQIGVNPDTGPFGASSRYYALYPAKVLPDGVHKWTSFKLNVTQFEKDVVVTRVRVSVNVDTTHRGDLQVLLEGPGGFSKMVHNEQGAGGDHLIIDDLDVTGSFEDVIANGAWFVRMQDRLKADIATVKSVMLEISTDKAQAPE